MVLYATFIIEKKLLVIPTLLTLQKWKSKTENVHRAFTNTQRITEYGIVAHAGKRCKEK